MKDMIQLKRMRMVKEEDERYCYEDTNGEENVKVEKL